MPYKDPDIQRLYVQKYLREWSTTHKDSIARSRKRYIETHPYENNREYQRKWYRDNQDKVKLNSVKSYQKGRSLINDVKVAYQCQNPECTCGELPAFCLDFHHIEKQTKTFNIGAGNRKRKALIDEINKCTVVCAVCHRYITAGLLNCATFKKCKIDTEGKITRDR